jgi:hypothetical protein
MAALLLTSLGPIAAQHAPKEVPKHLLHAADPASDNPFAPGWRPAEVQRDASGRITAAPLWCDALVESLAPGASVPAPAQRALGRPLSDITGWMEGEPRLSPVVVTTEHAVLLIDLPGLKSHRRIIAADEITWLREYFPKLKGALSPAQRAVLYGLRYLRMEARFLDSLGLLAADGDRRPLRLGGDHLGSKGRFQVFVFPTQEPYREFGRHFFGCFGWYTSWWYNKREDGMISALHATATRDADLLARFEFQVAQSLVYQYRAFYHHLPIWIPAGFGHHFQRLHRQVKPVFPELGYGKALEWDERNWDRAVRSLVASGKDIPLVKMAGLTQFPNFDGEFKGVHHAQCWSMVNFAMSFGPERWRRFLDEMKVKSRDESLVEVQYRAIDRAFEADLVSFHTAWRKWALSKKRRRSSSR